MSTKTGWPQGPTALWTPEMWQQADDHLKGTSGYIPPREVPQWLVEFNTRAIANLSNATAFNTGFEHKQAEQKANDNAE